MFDLEGRYIYGTAKCFCTAGGEVEVSYNAKCKGREFLVEVGADREIAYYSMDLEEAKALRDWLTSRINEITPPLPIRISEEIEPSTAIRAGTNGRDESHG